jgi:4'-phosphopantetheinyl transferase
MGSIQIENHCSVPVKWGKNDNSDFNVSNKIDLWRININSNLFFIDNALLVLNLDEIERANRYYQAKDRNRFAISRAALRIILGKYLGISPASVTFGLDFNKKPFIVNTEKSALRYNLSHSGDWVLIAVSSSEVGVDVEFIKQSFQYQEVIKDYFIADEIDYINQNSSLERFFLLWTRKEAFVKATGKGLDNDLRTIPSLDGTHAEDKISIVQNWYINSFKLNEHYIASLAGNHIINNVRYTSFDF